MLKELANALECFDWLSPIMCGVQSLIEGPSRTFLIGECGMTDLSVKRLLQRYGIKVWGLMYDRGTLMLTVRAGQAAFAQRILMKAGLPLLNGLKNEELYPAAHPKKKAQAARQPDLLDSLLDWLDL